MELADSLRGLEVASEHDTERCGYTGGFVDRHYHDPRPA
jgi:hypothetical protein